MIIFVKAISRTHLWYSVEEKNIFFGFSRVVQLHGIELK